MFRSICLLLLLLSLQVSATTVYKSVDARGRVTFSDRAPTDDSPVEVLHYHDSATLQPQLVTARIEAMREVTERMAADRREREASRAARRQPPAPLEYQDDYQPNYAGVYYRGYVRRSAGYRHGIRPLLHRPGLGPPALRPRFRPPLAGAPAIRSQYPAKLIRQHYTGAARRVFQPQGLVGY